jgi:hypothetical protein
MTLKFMDVLQGISRCPQCNVAAPQLNLLWKPAAVATRVTHHKQFWAVYQCTSCTRMVLAEGAHKQLVHGKTSDAHELISRLYPSGKGVDKSLPADAQRYLRQAIETIFAPDASIVVAASAVDAMLKAKGYSNGSLYARIDQAVQEHILTEAMGKWAHQVRLGANAIRHADDENIAPTQEDAEQTVEFASALGDFLFVLTARVEEGIGKAARKAGALAVSQ